MEVKKPQKNSSYYRLLMRQDLNQLLEEVQFVDIKWYTPEESGYYQPIVTAKKRNDKRK